ncbi:MAG: bifunctional 4-hydroxy-2-oxoglutarate aldolase/2-dehydro-3-deoxy-phosphogluconate aldolase [Victivallaceae bacterium]
MNTAQKLASVKIIPVLVINSLEDGMKIGELLVKHQLAAAEITFRTAIAATLIKELSRNFPSLCVGAGTILNATDLKRAFDAGAQFAVAPGFNPKVVQAAMAENLPFAPGVCTPSEIEQAVDLGCSLLKFFPAEAAGGIKMLKSLIAPYRHLGIRFMPTGGINPNNAVDYLSINEVVAVGGTWIGSETDIKLGNWSLIEDKIIEAAQLAGTIRK